LVVGQTRDHLSDAEVAVGLVVPEDWAITEAWNRFAPLVLVLIERTVGSKADAEDLTQEVFVRLLRAAATLREPEKLRSFVYSIAVRTLQSHLRSRRFKSWLSFQSPETLVDLRHCTLDVESRDLLRRFYVLLDRLPPRARLAFVLRRVEKMTVEEIGAAMDLSVSTVKRALQHASTRLSRWIEEDPALQELAQGRFT
jgi:RNA polymerase sigma-70 factor (ECF subfamily)